MCIFFKKNSNYRYTHTHPFLNCGGHFKKTYNLIFLEGEDVFYLIFSPSVSALTSLPPLKRSYIRAHKPALTCLAEEMPQLFFL